MHSSFRFSTFAALFALLVAAAGPIRAQIGNVAFVDPTLPPGTVGVVNDVNFPFRTISAAISVLAPMSSLGNEGLVCAQPGVYATTCNGEPFPIRMEDYVHVQGAGARETIIRGEGLTSWFGPGTFAGVGIFLPLPPEGARMPAEVLVDFGLCIQTDLAEMWDGFTMQGGDVQIYMEQESEISRLTVSNCVFDMLDDAPEVGVSGPEFGFLHVSIFNYTNDGQYVLGEPNLLNNTVILGWHPGTDRDSQSEVRALPTSVGFCDVSDPVSQLVYGPGFETDPNPDKLRGVSAPNVQNNVFRTLGASTAMLGISNEDTTAAVGTRIGQTNAFDRNRVGGFSGLYTSVVVGPTETLPLPWIDVRPGNPAGLSGIAQDPAFVCEFLSRSHGTTSPHLRVYRDWRLLPDSPLVDQGSAPLGGVLVALNGTPYLELGGPRSSFDFDGEGHGNARIVATPTAPTGPSVIDIGFDEAHVFIASGAYANDSDLVALSPLTGPFGQCSANLGQATRHVITPSAGGIQRFSSINIFSLVPFGFPCAPGLSECIHPGLAPGVVVTSPTFPAGYDTGFLRVGAIGGCPANAFVTFPPELVPAVTGYFAPFDLGFNPPHAFGELLTPVPTAPAGVGAWDGMQALFASAAMPGTILISNAQTERF